MTGMAATLFLRSASPVDRAATLVLRPATSLASVDTDPDSLVTSDVTAATAANIFPMSTGGGGGTTGPFMLT